MQQLPAWERLKAGPEGLRVEPPEAVMSETLLIADGDLPEVGGATVIHAMAAPDGFEIWAARLDGGRATTYIVRARRLRVRASDEALARLLGFDPERPPAQVEWTWVREKEASRADHEVVCVCRGITRGQVEAAVAAGWRTLDAVKRATKATFGECQSRRCAERVAEIIGLEAEDPLARITPRPPLVPVPASVLAAFGDGRASES